MTRIGKKVVHLVRCRFGIIKHRALRLESGNFAWPTQAMAARTRIMNVVYNASNNELVRTNTLVRNAIVMVDSTPFRQWFLKHYGIELGKKTEKKEAPKTEEPKAEEPEKKEEEKKEAEPEKKEEGEKKKAPREKGQPSKKQLRAFEKRQKKYTIEKALAEQFLTGKLLACITSRPGQVGRADGYILEGKELEFYQRKLEKKKKTN
jgi:small subunit ribosomal protein S8e